MNDINYDKKYGDNLDSAIKTLGKVNESSLNKSIFKVLLQYTWKFTDDIITKDLINTTAQIDINVYQLVVKDEFSRIVFFANWEDLGITTYENKKVTLFNTSNDVQVDLIIEDNE